MDEQRAKKWFSRLKRTLKDMPPDIEVYVSQSGVVSYGNVGAMDALLQRDGHIDHIGEIEADYFQARKLTGHESTV